MNTEEVAKNVVELTRKQAWKEALESLYAKDIISIEAWPNESGSTETRGIDGVRGKINWWLEAMETHSVRVHGPFVAHDRFVVQYDIDVTEKKLKERRQISEVGVYTVKDGRIVHEEFLPYVGEKS